MKVPKSGDLKLRVADKYLNWEEGKIFIFDDSFDHEVRYSSKCSIYLEVSHVCSSKVWHDADGDRMILIVDIWHPDLDDKTKASLQAI